MATNIIKIIDSQDKVVSQTQVASGKSITVSAKEGQSYEFVSGTTKRAPDEIKTTREGNNLKVEIQDGDATSTTIIEDYYTNGEGELVGLAEDGHYYNFVPEEMGNDYMVTDLADGVSSFQALGSEGDSMSPWWLGLPLLALGAAGGGGGSGAANTLDTTAPDAPSVTMVTDDYDGQEGSNYWGADVDTGSWSIDSATGDIITNGNGNVNSDGKIITNDNTPTLSGTGEAGTTVRVYNGDIDPNDPTINLVGETTVGPGGTWSVEVDLSKLYSYSPYADTDISGQLGGGNPGEDITLSVTLTDTAGNESEKSDINFILDTLITNTPMNISITDGINTVQTATDGENFYFTQPSFTISDDFFSYRTFSNPMGEDESVSYEEGTEIYITLTNRDTLQTYQIGGPDGPSVVVGSDGTWSVGVILADYGLLDGLYDMEVTIKEPSGDTYGTVGTFGIDTHAPEASDVDNSLSSSLADAYVHITLYDVSPIKVYSDAFGNEYPQGLTAQKLIIYCDGAEVDSVDLSLEFDGDYSEYSITYTDVGVGDGVHMYQVDTVDVAGNHSGLSEKAWVLVDADANHNLVDLELDTAKCFDEMVLVGNGNNETFTLSSVDFVSIDGGGNTNGGVDTFVLTGDGKILDIAQTQNFEVYNMGNNTLDIGSSVVDGDTDHVTINGTSSTQVNLDDSVWAVDSSATVSGYIVYNNTNGGDSLYIQDGVSVVI